MIYFTAHTFKCVCHCRRAMFRALGMYNFENSPEIQPMQFSLQYVNKLLHLMGFWLLNTDDINTADLVHADFCQT